jgi:hypothetical protein
MVESTGCADGYLPFPPADDPASRRRLELRPDHAVAHQETQLRLLLRATPADA